MGSFQYWQMDLPNGITLRSLRSLIGKECADDHIVFDLKENALTREFKEGKEFEEENSEIGLATLGVDKYCGAFLHIDTTYETTLLRISTHSAFVMPFNNIYCDSVDKFFEEVKKVININDELELIIKQKHDNSENKIK